MLYGVFETVGISILAVFFFVFSLEIMMEVIFGLGKSNRKTLITLEAPLRPFE